MYRGDTTGKSFKAMKNESLGEQIEGHIENRRMSRELAKEHEWCDKRIRELEAALSTAYGNLCNGLKVPAMGILEKALGLTAETGGEPLPKLECGMGCGRTFCSPEGRDHHEELCQGPTSKTEETACECMPLNVRGTPGDLEIFCPKCSKVFRKADTSKAETIAKPNCVVCGMQCGLTPNQCTARQTETLGKCSICGSTGHTHLYCYGTPAQQETEGKSRE